MSQDTTFDVIVIGGGVLGSFHAYHALERGLRVLLLEKDPAPRGATVQNFGQVVPSGMNVSWQHYGRKSLEIYHKIQAEFDISVRQNGSLYIASDAEELCLLEELHTINKANDYPSELWTKAQCQERYPTLKDSYCVAGLFFPQEVSVNPRQMIHRLHAYMALKPHFSMKANASVRELSINSTRDRVKVVTADSTVYQARKAILCSGVEFRLLYPDLFRTSDLQAVKLQMLRLRPQKHLRIPGNILSGLSIRRYESFCECPSYRSIKQKEDPNALWKKWGVHILFKQEDNGSIILGDSHQYAPAARAGDLPFELNQEVNDFMLAEAQKIFSLDKWEIEAAWAGYYSQSGSMPVFTRTVDRHIHIVTGIGGKGMTGSAGFAHAHLAEIL